MLIGVVSDTHGYVDPRLTIALAGVQAIVHAGDVGGVHVLVELGRIAPVYAVRGNNDVPLDGLGLPLRFDVALDGVDVHIVHELPDAQPFAYTRVVVFGHSHKQLAEWRGDVLYLNPGAAGRVGFHRMQTCALLRIEGTRVTAEPIELGVREKLPRAARAITSSMQDQS